MLGIALISTVGLRLFLRPRHCSCRARGRRLPAAIQQPEPRSCLLKERTWAAAPGVGKCSRIELPTQEDTRMRYRDLTIDLRSSKQGGFEARVGGQDAPVSFPMPV